MSLPSLAEHLAWLSKEAVPDEPISKAERRYESASSLAYVKVGESKLWQDLLHGLPDLADSYYAQSTGFKLFSSPEPPELFRKTGASLLDKVYRKNVVLNSNWPDAPVGGWITQLNWYERINDILRTTLVVKYLDGVDVLATHIAKLADQLGHEHKVDFEAREEGYYAAHIYVTHEVEIPGPAWDFTKVGIRLELQIATQLQDAIRKLTHEGYAARRSLEKGSVKWQWDYKDPQFTPNYLGHILHYVEGMIMEVRDRRSL